MRCGHEQMGKPALKLSLALLRDLVSESGEVVEEKCLQIQSLLGGAVGHGIGLDVG